MSAPGKFVWFDIMAHDKATAITFYTTLFDWNVNEVEMGPLGTYPMFAPKSLAEGGIGGCVEIGEEHRARLPSHWISYVTVDDVDAALVRVASAGGKVLQPAFDIPEVGRTAVCADPAGAWFSPFKEAGDSPDKPPGVGMPCWNELMTSDVEGAKAFYSKVLDYGIGVGHSEGYATFMRGDKPAAGLMQNPSPMPPHWLTYIWVDDIHATAAKVSALGGQVVAPVMDIPTIGKAAVCLDDQGAVFGIFGDPAA